MEEKQILESKAIKDFMSQYTAKQTIRQYKIAVKKYFMYIDKNPDRYLKDLRFIDNGKKLKAIDEYEKNISAYRNSLIADEYSPKCTHNYVSTIKLLLEHNHCDLDVSFWKKLKERGADKVVEPICDFKIPTTTELRTILAHATAQSRAMFLLQATSGLRIGEVVSLKRGDIDLDYDCPHIIIRGKTSKTRMKGRTRCSQEAKQAIIDWLNVRAKAIETINKRTPPEYQKSTTMNKDDYIFPVTTKSARKMWNRLLERAGFTGEDTSGKYARHLMSTHTLRKFFRNELSKYDNGLAQYLMNQRTGLDKRYRDYTDEYLDQEYAKGVRYLILNENYSGDVEKINESLKEKDEMIEKMQKQILELNTKINTINIDTIAELLKENILANKKP